MLKFSLMAGIFIGLIILVSCATSAVLETKPSIEIDAGKPAIDAPAKAGWELEMQKTAEAARKEGRVVVYMTTGAGLREALVKSFQEKYGVTMEAVSLSGSQMSEKLIRERRGGLYLADVYQGGVTTPVTILKPRGILDNLETAFIVPELKDPELIKQTWLEGKLRWVDPDHKVLAFAAYVSDWVLLNTDLVKPEEMTSLKDLLNPKWKGKIVMGDPSQSGKTGRMFGVVYELIYGPDFWRDFVKQEPMIIRDSRLVVEWVARGKYAIGLATKTEEVDMFMQMGAPLKRLVQSGDGATLASGDGGLVLINQAPHPNAAKLYINWLLSKEGLVAFTKAFGAPSARLDIPTDFLSPDKLRQPDVNYIWVEYEEFLLKESGRYKEAREIFGIK